MFYGFQKCYRSHGNRLEKFSFEENYFSKKNHV